MAREVFFNPQPIQAELAVPDQSALQLKSLFEAAGGLAGNIVQNINQDKQNQMAIDNAEARLGIARQDLVTQKTNDSNRAATESIKKLSEQEQIGVYSTIHNATPEELENMIRELPVLGDPNNLTLLQELAGKRMAMFDMPAITEIATRDNRSMTDVIEETLAARNLQNDLASAAYRDALTSSAVQFNTRMGLEGLKRETDQALATLELDLNRKVFNFSLHGTAVEVNDSISEFRKQARQLDPDLTDIQMNGVIENAIMQAVLSANPQEQNKILSDITEEVDENLAISLKGILLPAIHEANAKEVVAFRAEYLKEMENMRKALDRPDVNRGEHDKILAIFKGRLTEVTELKKLDDTSFTNKQKAIASISADEIQIEINNIEDGIVTRARNQRVEALKLMINNTESMETFGMSESALAEAKVETKNGNMLSPTFLQLADIETKLLDKRTNLELEVDVTNHRDGTRFVVLGERHDDAILKAVDREAANNPEWTYNDMVSYTYNEYKRIPSQMVDDFELLATSTDDANLQESMGIIDQLAKVNPAAARNLLFNTKQERLKSLGNLMDEGMVYTATLSAVAMNPESELHIQKAMDIIEGTKTIPGIDIQKAIIDGTDPGVLSYDAERLPAGVVRFYTDLVKMHFASTKNLYGATDEQAMRNAQSIAINEIKNRYEITRMNGTAYLLKSSDLKIDTPKQKKLLKKAIDVLITSDIDGFESGKEKIYLDFDKASQSDKGILVPLYSDGAKIYGMTTRGPLVKDGEPITFFIPYTDEGREEWARRMRKVESDKETALRLYRERNPSLFVLGK